MVDQTLPEINAVHEKNKARRYYYRLEQDFKKWLNQRTFTSWLKKYCLFKGWEWDTNNSNGLQWFMFINPDAPEVEDNNGIEF